MSVCNNCASTCRPSFVYIMHGRPDGLVKVGYAADVGARASSLRKQFSAPIQPAARFPMRCSYQAIWVETRAHELLKRYGDGTEWFRCSIRQAEKAIRKAIAEEKRF